MMQLTRRTRIEIIIIGVAILMMVGGVVLSNQLCEIQDGFLMPIDTWHTSQSSDNANIIWQTGTSYYSSDVSHRDFVISQGIILLEHPYRKGVCPFHKVMIVGVDVNTGRMLWSVPASNYNNSLYAYSSGFLVVNVSQFIARDYDGNELWSYGSGFRGYSPIHEVEGDLYIPTAESIIVVDSQTGRASRGQINVEDVVLYVSDERILIGSNDDYTLQLINEARPESVIYSIHLPQSRFQQVRMNPQYPLITLQDDILFVLYGNSGLEAYDFETGNLLWQVNQPIYSFPSVGERFVAFLNLNGVLEARNLQDGLLLSQIQLANDTYEIFPTTPFGFVIDTYQNKVVVHDFNLGDILAIEFDIQQH
jgi:hypothetical protein